MSPFVLCSFASAASLAEVNRTIEIITSRNIPLFGVEPGYQALFASTEAEYDGLYFLPSASRSTSFLAFIIHPKLFTPPDGGNALCVFDYDRDGQVDRGFICKSGEIIRSPANFNHWPKSETAVGVEYQRSWQGYFDTTISVLFAIVDRAKKRESHTE